MGPQHPPCTIYPPGFRDLSKGLEREMEMENRQAYSIFNAIAPPAQGIILEVEKLEAGVDVFDELADLKGAGKVA